MRKNKTVKETSFMFVVIVALLMGAFNVYLSVQLVHLQTSFQDLSDELSNLETHVIDFCDKEAVQS